MNRTYWACALILIAASIVATLAFYPKLPETIPMHWNIRGQIDGWGPRSTVWIMPGTMVGLLGLFFVLPKLSPKPFELDRAQSAYLFVMVLTIGMMGYIQALILWAAFSPKVDFSRAMVGGIVLMLALMGNVLGKIKRNLYIGVRTPWTIANERVWSETHRVAAWWFVGAGLTGFIIALSGLPIWLALIPLAPAVIWPVVFSYLLYKRLEREGKLPEDATAA
jgi:uncharacterized membrane protein